ncbi:MAG: cyclase family protein [Candidatus Izemoplasmatales bacterium]|jgi:kynurenine formamidase|nr:cyclase family protein [Candidatus Izemoplasmatales bacterium]
MNEWIDLTVNVKKSNLVFPGDDNLEIKKVKNLTDDGYNLNELTLNMHIGTHIDFKSHVYAKEEELIFQDFMGKANVIRPKVIDRIISTKDIVEKYDNLYYKEKILILDLKHHPLFNSSKYYDVPRFEMSILTFLKDNNITLLGADLPTFIYKDETDLKMHKDLLKNKIHLLENLTNLDELGGHIYLLALPLNIEGMEASLVRAIAKNI